MEYASWFASEYVPLTVSRNDADPPTQESPRGTTCATLTMSPNGAAPKPKEVPRETTHLSRDEILGFKRAVESSSSLFDFVETSYTMEYQQHKSLTSQELHNAACFHQTRGKLDLAEMLQMVLRIEAGNVIFLARPAEDMQESGNEVISSATWLAYGQRLGDVYNLVIAKGSQKRAVAKRHLYTCLGGFVVSGGTVLGISCLLGCPWISAAHCGAYVLAGAGWYGRQMIASPQFGQPMQNAVIGYIVSMMEQQNLIDLHGDRLALLMPSQPEGRGSEEHNQPQKSVNTFLARPVQDNRHGAGEQLTHSVEEIVD